MTTCPAPAKITRPVLRGSFPRERLFRLLDEARERPVVWVSGPPGCGKTTLVSGYLESRRIRCLWYRVDEGDSDIATFFHFMEQAARQAAPKKKKALSAPGGGRNAASPVAQRYFNDLFKRIGSPSYLVFDDWQNAAHRSTLDLMVREGISLLPKGIRAVFISRSDPSPDFAREVDRRRIEPIGWNDMRLTLEETEGIARTQWKNPTVDLVRYLQGRTGGWATGVVLLLDKAQQDGIEPQRIGRQTPEEIVNYLGGTLFERLDEETRTFLVKTAFLPRMTAGVAESLTGCPEAGRILARLNRNNFFTELRPGADPVYEYHSLFREFLLHRADGLLLAEKACATRQAAATLLESGGQTEDAVELLRQCGDFQGICRLLRKEAHSLVAQGRSRTVGDWIATLPGELLEEDPWLLYWNGACSIARNPEESIRSFERAFDRFARSEDATGTYLSWSGAVDTILGRWSDYGKLDRWIDWLGRRMAEGGTFPSTEVEARVATSMTGALFHRRPQQDELRAWASRALSASRDTGDKNILLQALVAVAGVYHAAGDRSAASLAMEEIRHMSRSPAVSLLNAIAGKWHEALAELWSNADPEAALGIVSEGLDTTRLHGLQLWDHLFYSAGAYASLMKGDEVRARDFLDKLKISIPPGCSLVHSEYDYLAAWHHLLLDDAVGAAAHGARALDRAESAGVVFPAIMCRLAMANISCRRIEHAEAGTHLAAATELMRTTRSGILEFMARLTEARIALIAGDEAKGIEALRAGMAIGRKQGYVNMFWWWEPDVMSRLCMKALEAGIETGYAIELMRKRHLVPDHPPMEVEEWPWKIRIYTLGRFGIAQDGKRIAFTGKAQQKPLRLLKALIALGGREVPREKLADALWPEAEGDLALQSLAVTVRRLRSLLGDEKAVHLTEGRITLCNRICWVDFWAFKRLFSRAEKSLREDAGSGSRAAAHLEKALGLYRGDFLEDEKETPWAVPARERLRIKFLRCVMDAGRIHESAGEWDKALDCYRKGLSADDIHEEFYRRKMTCLHRLGRTSEALATYRQCFRTLAALGAALSPETESIYSSIRNEAEKFPAGKSPEKIG